MEPALLFGLLVLLVVAGVVVLLRKGRRRGQEEMLRVRDLPFPHDSTARKALDDAYSRGEMSREHYEDRVRRLGDST